MNRVRLKDAISQIGGILYEVELNRSRWQEEAIKTKRQRFKEAVAYAKAALVDSQVRLRYKTMAKKQNTRLWDVASAYYFKGNDLLARQ